MNVLSSILARSGAVLLFIVLALSACTVVVEEEGPRGPGPICTREYDPVCARRGGDRETFANACLAEAAGYRIIRRGECRRDDDRPQFCTQQYDPVCARRGRDRQTFSNACLAEAAGYRIISDGQCRRGDDRICSRIYAPVCARRGGHVRTFPNSCEADVAGYRIVSDGRC